MRSVYSVAALLAVASAQQSNYDSLFSQPSSSRYNQPQQYSARPTTSSYQAPRSSSQYQPSYSSHLRPSYGYPAPVPKEPEPKHEHDNSIQHENLWDQCKRDIASSQMTFQAVSDTCAEAVEDIPALMASCDKLEETVDLEDTEATLDDLNEMGGIVSCNEAEQVQIDAMKDKVTEILGKLSDQKLILSMTQMMVDMLPGLMGLQEKLDAMAAKQGEVDENGVIVTPGVKRTTNDAQMLTDAQILTAAGLFDMEDSPFTPGMISNLTEAVSDLQEDLTGLLVRSGAVKDKDVEIAGLLMDKQDEFAKQEILDYYFFVNNVGYEPDMDTDLFDEGKFKICTPDDEDFAVLEFFLNADFTSVIGTGGPGTCREVTQIELVKNSVTVVASANYTDLQELCQTNRNFNIYYKGKVAANDDFQIRVILAGDSAFTPESRPLEFQWGYKTFPMEYPLVMDLSDANGPELTACEMPM